jgi:hypothetical protein
MPFIIVSTSNPDIRVRVRSVDIHYTQMDAIFARWLLGNGIHVGLCLYECDILDPAPYGDYVLYICMNLIRLAEMPPVNESESFEEFLRRVEYVEKPVTEKICKLDLILED